MTARVSDRRGAPMRLAPAFAWVKCRSSVASGPVALANKAARIAWAILVRGEIYRDRQR